VSSTSRPKQTALATQEEGGLSLVRPAVWLSRIFPGVKIAVSIRDVQSLCPSRHGPPPVERCQRFLLYCAGYGVDPRIGQAYLIPFETEGQHGQKIVVWQEGLNYQVFQRFANETGVILGADIEPDPELWPVAYPGDEFHAKITIYRRRPLRTVTYGCAVGSVVKKQGGKPARAWADGKVGWAHMFQVALERRGFRRAMGLGSAYAAEEFGEAEPQMPEGFEEAEVLPPAAELAASVAAAVAAEEGLAEDAPRARAEEAPEEVPAEEEGPAEAEPQEQAPAESAADGEEGPEETAPAEAPAAGGEEEAAEAVKDLRSGLQADMIRVFSRGGKSDREAGLDWLRYKFGAEVGGCGALTAGQCEVGMQELASQAAGAMYGWKRPTGKGKNERPNPDLFK